MEIFHYTCSKSNLRIVNILLLFRWTCSQMGILGCPPWAPPGQHFQKMGRAWLARGFYRCFFSRAWVANGYFPENFESPPVRSPSHIYSGHCYSIALLFYVINHMTILLYCAVILYIYIIFYRMILQYISL